MGVPGNDVWVAGWCCRLPRRFAPRNDVRGFLAMTYGEGVVSRRMENGSKVCVVAMVYVISIETWSRRMENGLKVCVVTLVKRGRYDYEAMHVHHVIVKPGPRHVIAKPGGLWESF